MQSSESCFERASILVDNIASGMRLGILIFAGVVALGTPMSALAQGLIYNLMTPQSVVTSDARLTVDIVVMNPTDISAGYELPQALSGYLSSRTQSWAVELVTSGLAVGQVNSHGYAYHSYTFALPEGADGQLILELERPTRMRAVIAVAEVHEKEEAQQVASAPLSNVLTAQTAAAAIKRTFLDRFEPHESVYFIYGSGRHSAKFQFSFKYRLFGDNALGTNEGKGPKGLYFGLTQRSLWNIDDDSSPFYDTSYMPELVYQSQALVDPDANEFIQWLGYQVALKHESNGQDGPDSRSLNIAYVRTAFVLGEIKGWHAIVVPRIYAYVGDVANNPDIADYRGYGDLSIVLGRNDGLALTLTGQLGKGGHHGSIQADLTYPLKFDRYLDFATYLLIQYWDGYTESLLDYRDTTSSFRIGFSLVR